MPVAKNGKIRLTGADPAFTSIANLEIISVIFTISGADAGDTVQLRRTAASGDILFEAYSASSSWSKEISPYGCVGTSGGLYFNYAGAGDPTEQFCTVYVK